jgi:hypothetical protein
MPLAQHMPGFASVLEIGRLLFFFSLIEKKKEKEKKLRSWEIRQTEVSYTPVTWGY